MKRRSRAGGKASKVRGREALKKKRRDASTTVSLSNPIKDADARLTRELNEAREQQTATTDVLRVISRTTFNLQAVFAMLLETAARLCRADKATILQLGDGQLHLVADYGLSADFRAYMQANPMTVDRTSASGLAVLSGEVVQVTDLPADPILTKPSRRLGGYRTALGVPLMREAISIGVMFLTRDKVDPFSQQQIDLVTTFAAQAVIAIENARLLNELKQSLEQQTATAEVLSVISSSLGELQPVFQAMLENATRLCEAKFGTLYFREAESFRAVAMHGAPPAYLKRLGSLFQPTPISALGQAVRTKQVVHIEDVTIDPAYFERDPIRVSSVEEGGVRTLLGVPMMKENEVIGAIGIYRETVHPFTDRHIALVTNFAAQAVIAIENARLLNELRQSLEQQTATSEVLQVISSSPGALQPVFDAMLTNATRLCEASFGILLRYENAAFQVAASHNAPPAFVELRRREPTIRASGVLRRVVATKQLLHISDCLEDASYKQGDADFVRFVDLCGARSFIAAPMLKDDELVGTITVFHQEVRPFTDKQIELVKNFAAQAVIAIENARLLNELRQRTGELETSLEYQTATSDVLKVISRSVFDLQKILEFVAETAARLCGAKQVAIYLLEDHVYRFTVSFGLTPAYRKIEEALAIEPGPETLVGRVALSGEPVHILDCLSDPNYGPKDDIRATQVHTLLGVPLTREGKVVGVIALAREPILPFSREQIDLVRTFADQAVIAIENARLLKELRERTDQLQMQSQELAKLNQDLEQRVTDQVGEIERMSRLRRFLPPQVADLIVASGSEKQLESHRREVTALFCDLRGFTGFSESADPEDVMTLLREYHEAIGASIIKYCGTLERYAGDGVMVVFNDPVPVANPALQAVLMALEMRDAIGALTETWRRLGHDIGFGIGIAHGFATLGTIGFEGRFDYAAIGTVSNVASRLCDEAKPGQILITPRVLTKVENVVTVEPVGEFELKGIRRPLAAYNVVAAQSSNT